MCRAQFPAWKDVQPQGGDVPVGTEVGGIADAPRADGERERAQLAYLHAAAVEQEAAHLVLQGRDHGYDGGAVEKPRVAGYMAAKLVKRHRMVRGAGKPFAPCAGAVVVVLVESIFHRHSVFSAKVAVSDMT